MVNPAEIKAILEQLFREQADRLIGLSEDALLALVLGQDGQTARLSAINRIMRELEENFQAFALTYTQQEYADGWNSVAQLFGRFGLDEGAINPGMLSIFVSDMAKDFSIGLNGARKVVGSFFKFSKQGVLTETELTDAVARGWIKQGTSRVGLREVAARLRDKISTSSAARLTEDEEKAAIKQIIQAYRKRGVPSQFIESMERMVQNDGFIRIIDKNGKPRVFRISTYAEFVTRTRTGDAQVRGTLDAGNRYGVTEFQVTSHNTETPICKPHEGQIYTTNPANTDRFKLLTPENTPTYHVNCEHRLIARVLTGGTFT